MPHPATAPSERGEDVPSPGVPAPVADWSEQVRALSDRALLGELVDRYMATLDRGVFDDDWAGSLFTEDVHLVFPVGSHRGVAGAAEFTREIMERWERTHHHASGCVIASDGDLASVGWSLIASHVHFDSPPPPATSRYFQLGGRFDGTARRTPDGWRFESLKLRIVWTTGAVPPSVTSIDAKTIDAHGTDGSTPERKAE
ncbi:nuclear transport factor 2 family protein [Streptomyces sp. TRM43335]|uniref:Nuclear transport factor 2 family protein n=1 Tax=Streptomyces taklimakanensis TaxID=2569853 RepID=A0A6G2BG11_9ACTN|nr:nuclear transport factor 2 family protein [Streptomyces taklimakanensis]MTE21009.1 nuclear transport factor 2 family protein [Streptomyces taklimakanensis]